MSLSIQPICKTSPSVNFSDSVLTLEVYDELNDKYIYVHKISSSIISIAAYGGVNWTTNRDFQLKQINRYLIEEAEHYGSLGGCLQLRSWKIDNREIENITPETNKIFNQVEVELFDYMTNSWKTFTIDADDIDSNNNINSRSITDYIAENSGSLGMKKYVYGIASYKLI